MGNGVVDEGCLVRESGRRVELRSGIRVREALARVVDVVAQNPPRGVRRKAPPRMTSLERLKKQYESATAVVLRRARVYAPGLAGRLALATGSSSQDTSFSIDRQNPRRVDSVRQ